MRFIERNADRPFFLEVAYTAPHWPFQPPDRRPADPLAVPNPAEEGDLRLLQSPEDAVPATRDDYVRMVERADEGVGKIMGALDRLGLAGNTLVIFTNDNGGEWLSRNDPFSNRKSSVWEGGIRVPMILRWPGKIPVAKPTPASASTCPRRTPRSYAGCGARSRPGRKISPRVHYDGRVSASLIRALGLGGSLIYAIFIGWLYVTEPATIAEVAGGVASGLNVYRADEASFQEGLRLFRADNFEAARTAFDRSDPAKRDSRVQFYVAYSFYRQGWGRVWNDDALFRQGVAALDRAVRADTSGRVVVNDATLGMTTSDELRAELEEGLRRDSSDYNPMRLMRKRK